MTDAICSGTDGMEAAEFSEDGAEGVLPLSVDSAAGAAAVAEGGAVNSAGLGAGVGTAALVSAGTFGGPALAGVSLAVTGLAPEGAVPVAPESDAVALKLLAVMLLACASEGVEVLGAGGA